MATTDSNAQQGDDAPEPEGDFDLAEAYAVQTPDDNRELYRKWAATYESGFMTDRGYVYHEQVAGLLLDSITEPAAAEPLLDVGCGTGAVGEALARRGAGVIDGVDISPEMLAKAATKRRPDGSPVYRNLTEADLTVGIDMSDATFRAVISVGTFTHGHLGPEPIDELVRVAAAGAAFALGINAEHYASRGFEAHLAHLTERGLISAVRLAQARIYTAGDDDHVDDLATVALFRRV